MGGSAALLRAAPDARGGDEQCACCLPTYPDGPQDPVRGRRINVLVLATAAAGACTGAWSVSYLSSHATFTRVSGQWCVATGITHSLTPARQRQQVAAMVAAGPLPEVAAHRPLLTVVAVEHIYPEEIVQLLLPQACHLGLHHLPSPQLELGKQGVVALLRRSEGSAT